MIQKLWFPERKDWYVQTLIAEDQDEYYAFKKVHDHIAEEVGGHTGWRMKMFTLDLIDRGLYSPYIHEYGGQVIYGVLLWSFTHGTYVPVQRMEPIERELIRSMVDYYASTN